MLFVAAILAVILAVARTYFRAIKGVHASGRLRGYELLAKARPLTPAEVAEVARLSAWKREYDGR